jgi:hypothetical protein
LWVKLRARLRGIGSQFLNSLQIFSQGIAASYGELDPTKIKSDLRKHKPRSVEAVCDSLTFAFYSITPEQAQNHFSNAILNISHQQ